MPPRSDEFVRYFLGDTSFAPVTVIPVTLRPPPSPVTVRDCGPLVGNATYTVITNPCLE